MKAWSQPEMEELNVRATAYSPKGGLIEDGVYQSDDGKYTIPTYGPSSGNSGEPTVDVQQFLDCMRGKCQNGSGKLMVTWAFLVYMMSQPTRLTDGDRACKRRENRKWTKRQKSE